ncbi:hypothetical protein [Anaeromyxobacter sp. SG66]|uniref:hypothetical protein n=1 Tax=Anaeromyxobacter sp. SG66 TaxID=2925410 RepID=UPI001F5A2878|nr:hypothetical protein [Anaeromyxobacter sp. SG66]
MAPENTRGQSPSTVLKPPPTSIEFAAVLDTNVYIDIVSIHDLLRAPEERREMRVERLRDAALLAICFHENSSTTYGLREGADVLAELVPPESGGFEEQHLKAFSYFVYPHVLSRWHVVHPNDVNVRANAADRHLTDFAFENGLPLVTLDARMGERAAARGVSVLTPRGYWELRMNSDAAVQRFFRRYRSNAPVFARSTSQPRPWVVALDQLYEQYRRLLLGR